ncbi:MAG: hypothetical protein ACYTAN_17265 [Planctomycetota bacterium]|jgi:uncharacterized membrane protein
MQTQHTAGTIAPQLATRVITSLRLVFWGGLLVVLDLTITSGGFTVDILNDFVGMILVSVGVWRLSEIRFDERYTSAMTFARVVAVIATIGCFIKMIMPGLPPVLALLIQMFQVITVIALVAFCISMRRLCDAGMLSRAAASWKMTTALVVLMYLVPLVLALGPSIAMGIQGKTYKYDIGFFPALLLVAVFLIPLVHFFVSTSRMKRGIAARGSVT